MTRLLLCLLLLLLPTLALAEARLALTRESEAGFKELIQRSQSGALGDAIVNLNVRIQKDRVQVDLKERAGGVRTLWLRPAVHGARGFFQIEPGERATPDDVAKLLKLLGQVFAADPFLMENDGMDASRVVQAPSVTDALHADGVRGATVALVENASGPISRTTMLLTAFLPFLGFSLAVIALWGAALRNESSEINRP